MSEDTKKAQVITLDGKEYDFSTFTEEQKVIINHIADLDRKIDSARFSLDQLNVGKQAFVGLLKESLTKAE